MTVDQTTRNSELFEQTWDDAIPNIERVTQDKDEQLFLKSLVMGGTVAAEVVINGCIAILPYWGEGDRARAREISQLFSFLMLSQCYRWLDEKDETRSQERLPKETVSSKLIDIFEGEAEQGLDDFSHFDSQFNYDLDKHPHMVHLAGLILAKVSDICGHRCLDWAQVYFPVVEFTHIMKKDIVLDSAPMRSQDDINMVVKALTTGTEAMMRYYDGA